MSTTLRIWLSAPLQSWGTASRFEARTTDLAPSKSGVVGLLCAALGRHRGEPVDDLAALRFGVRVETPGSVLRDFHTVGAGRDASGIAVASGARSQARGVVTQRYYLQDAAFVAGLEGDDPELLSQLRDAVARPRWPLALGRRSCPPAGPLVDADALVAEPLEVALARHWCPAGAPDGLLGTGEDVELLIEDAKGALELQDAPLGAAFRNRTFAVRRVRSRWVTGDREVV